MKNKPSGIFAILFGILLSISSVGILNVQAQPELPTIYIHIASPSSKTYTENTVLLNISYYTEPQDQKEYKIVYWLTFENISNSTSLFQGVIGHSQPIWQSTQLTELSDGSYSLRVSSDYVDGRWWIYAYETPIINFTINTSIPQLPASPTPSFSAVSSPFPPEAEYLGYIITIILALIVIIIGFGIFAYLVKKRTIK